MSRSCSLLRVRPQTGRTRLCGQRIALSVVLAGAGLTASACATTASSRRAKTPSSALRIVVAAQDKDAEVWVDGQYLGVVQELEDPRTGRPRLAPGVHRVEVRKPGRFPVQRTVEVPRDPPPETTVQAELLPDPR